MSIAKEKTIRTTLVSLMTSNLSSYKRIINPYDFDANPETIMRKAYGIGFLDSSNTERFLGCSKLSKLRTLQLPMINQVTVTQSDRDGFESLENDIFYDQLLMIKALENDPDLNEVALKARWVSDEGLEYLETDRNKYFLINNIIEVEFTESLT